MRVWSPPEGVPPKAVILALHGFGDHLTTFEELADWLAPQAIELRAYDLIGFGERPDRGFWRGSQALRVQLAERIAEARAARPGLPLFVLGDSMGAAVTVLGTTGPDAPALDGIVLVAPAVWGGRSLSPLYRGTLRLLNEVAPAWRVSGQGLGIQASDNIAALIARGRDPLYLRQPIIQMVAGVVQLMDDVQPLADTMRLPTLVLLGERDQVVPPQAQQAFTAAIAAADCLAVRYPEGWHLLLSDHQRETVWRDLAAWVTGARELPSSLQRRCRDVTDGSESSG